MVFESFSNYLSGAFSKSVIKGENSVDFNKLFIFSLSNFSVFFIYSVQFACNCFVMQLLLSSSTFDIFLICSIFIFALSVVNYLQINQLPLIEWLGGIFIFSCFLFYYQSHIYQPYNTLCIFQILRLIVLFFRFIWIDY